MNKEKLRFIIDCYGTKTQEEIALEELAELQKAILKFRREKNRKTYCDIIDELADVEIMLEQLKIIYSCHSEVKERVDYKINRQISRILKKYNIKE